MKRRAYPRVRQLKELVLHDQKVTRLIKQYEIGIISYRS